MQGILLIGMPYVGKSTIGEEVAQILRFSFLDGDTEIEKIYPDRQRFLDAKGDEAYITMEADVVMGLSREDTVLAPGASIIYSSKAKKYLKGCFKVYLSASLGTIKKRITNIDKRGIVRLKKKGLEALYAERKKLFRRYCDIVIDVESKGSSEIARVIARHYALRQFGGKKEKVGFVSTNGGSHVSFTKAMMQGLAPDKGLYVPLKLPSFSKELGLLHHLPYSDTAFAVMRQFADIPDKKLREMCDDAYTFSILIERHGNLVIARMDQGPTASFKDFAAQLLARMMSYASKGKRLVVLAATSGDTGGAVASAFGKVKNAKVIILMPEREVTQMQRRQMTTAGKNVVAVRVQGTFDECQALVKKAFIELKGLTSANSISIGRLLPQIAYYFFIYGRTGAKTFVVPSGNFGNVVAGLFARSMGLPVKFVAAVNSNDEVSKFLENGEYHPIIPSRKCISNAMNVGNPSNLVRIIWLYGGRMDEKGNMIKRPDMEKLREDLACVSVGDWETREAIRKANQRGIVLEPHGAVGYAALAFLPKGWDKVVLLETAHPAKFPDELDAAGVKYSIPKSMEMLIHAKEEFIIISPDFEQLAEILRKLR